jgi:hypothetical protein
MLCCCINKTLLRLIFYSLATGMTVLGLLTFMFLMAAYSKQDWVMDLIDIDATIHPNLKSVIGFFPTGVLATSLLAVFLGPSLHIVQ